jgi:hypothetical protein
MVPAFVRSDVENRSMPDFSTTARNPAAPRPGKVASACLGLLRRALGFGPVYELGDSIEAQCNQKAAAGDDEASFTITEGQLGRIRMDDAVRIIGERIASSGHQIEGFDAPAWSRTAVIRVRLQSPWAASPPTRPGPEALVTEAFVPVSGPMLGSEKRVLAIVDGPDGTVYRPEDLLHAVDPATVPATINRDGEALGVALCGKAVRLWPAAFEPQLDGSRLYATQVVVTDATLVCCNQCLKLVGVELSS